MKSEAIICVLLVVIIGLLVAARSDREDISRKVEFMAATPVPAPVTIGPVQRHRPITKTVYAQDFSVDTGENRDVELKLADLESRISVLERESKTVSTFETNETTGQSFGHSVISQPVAEPLYIESAAPVYVEPVPEMPISAVPVAEPVFHATPIVGSAMMPITSAGSTGNSFPVPNVSSVFSSPAGGGSTGTFSSFGPSLPQPTVTWSASPYRPSRRSSLLSRGYSRRTPIRFMNPQ